MRGYVLVLASVLMFLYLLGSVLSGSSLGLAVSLAYITFLATGGAITYATGYGIWAALYTLAAIVLLVAGIAMAGREGK